MIFSPLHLSSVFKGACVKRLSATESDPQTSHGHEFQGIKAFVELFGKPTGGEKLIIPTRFIYLNDNTHVEDSGTLTFYDSRWKNPNRPAEYRLYYSDNRVTNSIFTDDCLIIARDLNDNAVVITAQNESDILSDVLLLFGLTQDVKSGKFTIIKEDNINQRIIPSTLHWLAEILGINCTQESYYQNEILEKFGYNFPSTASFSAYARSRSNFQHATDGNADDVLYDWYNTEHFLFNIFEKLLLNKQIKDGITPDNFITCAYSFIQRRYSRAGQSLENHIAHLFNDFNIMFSRTPTTEAKSKPDFLFPSIEYYKDDDFPSALLHMLAVKTTCKDRWRQVLVEADRIPHKHLLTLQGAISIHQTDEMSKHNLQLVIPKPIHPSFTPQQQNKLLTVEQFLSIVRESQSSLPIIRRK